ncbi:MAG: hypothetical protein QG608_2036 [Actinomycetota bacterium]|nr:hypothetical protein [Actinomycetota bacterium]
MLQRQKFRILRPSTTAVLGIVSVVTLLGVSSIPANAATAPSGCNTGYACFFADANFKKGPYSVAGTESNFQTINAKLCPSGTLNDCISSVWNNKSSAAKYPYLYLFVSANWADTTYLKVPRQQGFNDLSKKQCTHTGCGPNHTYNDAISSNEWH